MKILKKNQLTLLVISLMLITAGYLNYSSTYNQKAEEAGSDSIDVAKIGDAELVNSNVVDENSAENNTLNENINSNVAEQNTTNTSTQIENEKNNDENNYFATSKLERNVMYSQMIERYQSILDSSNGYTEQKGIAQEEINKINELQNAIMIAENLLTTKGFDQNIIFVNGDSISVIIGKENLSQDEIAQIQNIISRELNAKVDNIHISLK